MSRETTITFQKDGVEYELEIEEDRWGGVAINSVTVLNGIGVAKPEQDIDPEEFSQKLTDNEWVEIGEKL